MHHERVEGAWIDAFEHTLKLCAIQPGDEVAILSETQSRAVNVHLAELALLRIGARPFHVVMPTPSNGGPIPLRSTGSSRVVDGHEAALAGLAAASIVVDVTIEGVLNSSDRPPVLAQGARHFFISNEHPEILERCRPDPSLEPVIERAYVQMANAREMRVTSAAGSDLTVDLTDCNPLVSRGYVTEPGKGDHWPGGLVTCFPALNTVNGTLVLDRGDLNLTFKRYNEEPVTLRIEDDYVVAIEGDGIDARMLRQYMADWREPEAYATSHVGWGLNPGARWDGATYYDKVQHNGTEARAFEGNFLYSTGSNYGVGRFSKCHFDWPMANCTVALDGEKVVDEGRLLDRDAGWRK